MNFEIALLLGVVQYAFNVPNDHSSIRQHVCRDYFKLRFQIFQLIVDVLFLIWSTHGKHGLPLDHRSICYFRLASLRLQR